MTIHPPGLVGWFPRAALGNEQSTHEGLVEPTHNILGRELEAVIAPKMLWSAANGEQVSKPGRYSRL